MYQTHLVIKEMYLSKYAPKVTCVHHLGRIYLKSFSEEKKKHIPISLLTGHTNWTTLRQKTHT